MNLSKLNPIEMKSPNASDQALAGLAMKSGTGDFSKG